MQITPLAIPAVKLLQPQRFGDHRGYFAETFSLPKLADHGIDLAFVQDNESLSAQPATVRGLHFQSPPHAQDKLVRCVRGSFLDVAVDIRAGSPTFGRHVSAVLSADNGDQLLVPRGFAHGFATLEPDTVILYKVTDVYAPQCDAGVLWNDPDLAIDWQLPADAAEPVLSEKDAALPRLKDLDSPFTYDPDDDTPPTPGARP
ncbi:MAG: dTDP-4-dehydrorhamnose 3,5-epimerase [Planctomycetota bacterium]